MADHPANSNGGGGGGGDDEPNHPFWQQVARATEGSIEPPADGWQKISRRIDVEARRTELEPPPPPAGGLRLPGFLVWFVGLFALITLFVIAAHTGPKPVDAGPGLVAPIHPTPVETGTRQMQIAYEGAVSATLKETHLRLDFRITNTGTDAIVIPGPGGTTLNSPHYLLDVRQASEALLQLPLVADSADLRLNNGTAPGVADPSLDLTLAPGESVSAHVFGEVARVFPHGAGVYELRVHYLPPSLSERTSPPDTISPPVLVRVGK